MGQNSNIVYNEKNPLQDHCGIVAAFSTLDTTFFTQGVKALAVVQTRGYDGAGFCAIDTAGKPITYKGIGMVNEVFNEEKHIEFQKTKARSWVYQVRYGTSGAFKAENVQPFLGKHTQTGEAFTIAHNGQFSKEPGNNESDSDTFLFTKQLENAAGDDWDTRIQNTLAAKKGAWSLVIGTKDALYVARDTYGFRPLTYGHVWNEQTKQFSWVVASETSALEAIGVTNFFEVLPGSLAKITTAGFKILEKQKGFPRAHCIFENIYIQHGAGKALFPRGNARAINKAQTVDEVRRRSGKILAREAPLSKTDVDMVIGVPGTGIEGGMLFARTLNIPYFQAITDRAEELFEQRTFMTARIESIYEKVLDHFNFDAQALVKRRVVLVDDSIVRGNVTKGLVYLLKRYYHVTAVHLRVLSPAIDKICHLGLNTRNEKELIAAIHSGDTETIRKALDAESLAYLSAPGLKEAITGDPKAPGFCMGCMVGFKHPIDEAGNPNTARFKKSQKKKIINQFPLPLRV